MVKLDHHYIIELNQLFMKAMTYFKMYINLTNLILMKIIFIQWLIFQHHNQSDENVEGQQSDGNAVCKALLSIF